MTRAVRLSAVLLLAMVPLTGCLFRSHKVEQLPSSVLRVATKQELVDRINSEAAKIQTLNATVDIATSVGGAKKGKVTEYKEIRGYILMRQPNMLRMIGLMPIVRSRAFDMVSNGQTFELWVPPKNKFYVGRNDVVNPSKTGSLENLRPDVVYNALLVHQVNPKEDIAVLENSVQDVADPKTKKPVQQANYILDVITRGPAGWYLERKIYFNRLNLEPERQVIYDRTGNIATDAQYRNFLQYDGVSLPNVIEINRPQEEYDITISMVKLTMNKPLTDEQFALAQPPGAQVVRLDQPTNGAVARDGGKPQPSNP